MPTPVAKGIIIGVAALVAAGIAVYESPQFRRWVDNSRRKLATALHNLGDGVHPGEAGLPLQHDISMMEEVGPAAEERRRIAREELQRRRSLLEERQKKRSNSSLGTFDTLVDKDGRLLDITDQAPSMAKTTAVDLGASQPVQRGKQPEISPAESTVLYEAEPVSERPGLQLSMPTPRSRASTLSHAEFTPVSEVSNSMSGLIVSRESVDEQRPVSSLSSHTVGSLPEVIYAHPESIANGTTEDTWSPFSDLEGLRFAQDRPATPPTPSTADNFSHIAVDASSDGTLSDFEGSVGRAHTPASWSEIGSVSSEEYHQHGL
ncbi:hypothetical protein BJX63DRAFT_393703 [Aspergillus granulosus]|uniref:Uncharacterized protein n=1 Tax=Aspergillus granulosus TaxID=176169 RepID=A0ABR4HG05_9EURO